MSQTCSCYPKDGVGSRVRGFPDHRANTGETVEHPATIVSVPIPDLVASAAVRCFGFHFGCITKAKINGEENSLPCLDTHRYPFSPVSHLTVTTDTKSLRTTF